MMEKCKCGKNAYHKVAEDYLGRDRHEFTTYLCCDCFGELFGPVAVRWCNSREIESLAWHVIERNHELWERLAKE